MAGSTNFIQFNPNKTNMIDDTTYSASDYRVNGCRTGLAPSPIHNKLFYQTSTFVAAYAKMLANKGFIVNDSDYSALVTVLNNIAITSEYPKTLDNLTDVVITDPTDKQLLTYNFTNKKWENKTLDTTLANMGSVGLKRQVITASGTFVVPVGVTEVFISGCAGGAGGSSVWALGGGAGESCTLFPITVNPGETITVTIGTGGIGGVAFSGIFDPISFNFTTTKGSKGGNTVFGTYKTLIGGTSPTVAAAIAEPGLNGGPNSTRGDLPTIFDFTSTTLFKNQVLRKGGNGGNSLFGSGGAGGIYAGINQAGVAKAGQNGIGFGAGGAGGGEYQDKAGNVYTVTAGGNGANGIVTVEWYA